MGRVFGKRKREIMAENSAIVAEYSMNCDCVFSKSMAEVSAREKNIWLRFQQIHEVAHLISKHERGRKMKEICVT